MSRHTLPIGTIYIEDMQPGLTRTIAKTITEKEIALFAEVSEDQNPVHLDEDYASSTLFKGKIAHGMLSAALFSAIIGEQLPGHGAIYLSQSLKFTAPVRPGDHVVAEVSVAEVFLAKRRVSLLCLARVGDTVVIRGEALVLAPSRFT
jgi:3-hydroxybutyryl-CoA dehydratase